MTDDYCMSSTGLRRAALAVAAAAVAGLAGIAAAPAAVAHPIGHLSEADALFLPQPSKVPALTGSVSSAATTGASTRMAALTAASYKFSSILDGAPLRWNPCQAIHWRATVARRPVGGLDVLKAAVAHIANTTGTTWVFDGVTLTVPSTAYLPTNPTNTNKPVLIGWTDGTSSDLLRGQPA